MTLQTLIDTLRATQQWTEYTIKMDYRVAKAISEFRVTASLRDLIEFLELCHGAEDPEITKRQTTVGGTQ